MVHTYAKTACISLKLKLIIQEIIEIRKKKS